jgi:hypothetical protein
MFCTKTEMRRLVAMAVILGVGVLGGCAKRPSQTSDEIAVFPAVVGTKTPLYEVVASNKLRLAPGAKFRIVEGPGGKKNGIVILQLDDSPGGYMACGCVGAQSGNCEAVSDNPANASCSGSCLDSEGNAHGCELFGPLIGPPRDPAGVRFEPSPRPTSSPRIGGGNEAKPD